MYKKFLWCGAILVGVLLLGTIGYWFIGARQYSFVDTFYMTIITVTTIGFTEVVDMSGSPGGRLFTIFIALSGIGVLAYMATNITALVVEGELTNSFRRRRMERMAGGFKDHYIICGLGSAGVHILNELHATGRPHVIVEASRSNIEKHLCNLQDEVFIEGDATDNNTLVKAGIEKARGLFAVAGDDNQNLVITLTARHLNPSLRIVAQCDEAKNGEKMRRAGADAAVSPGYIGGLRMASEMIRPTAVTFLDIMLRDREKNLRVEEVPVPDEYAGKALSELNLKRFPDLLLLAVETEGNWVYNPPRSYIARRGDILVFMTTPEERHELEKVFLAS